MERNRSYSKGKKHWKHSNNHGQKNEKAKPETVEEKPLVRIKVESANCAYCGKPIEEMASAMASREKGEPVHFDCVLEKLHESERINSDERITYLGGGKFGVIHYPNPQDTVHFEIRRTIEWESRDAKYEWRKSISDLYSNTTAKP